MPFNLPPETPWYVVMVVLALYGLWRLIKPYLVTRVQNASRESTAVSESRVERIELEQRRQLAEFEGQKALLTHLGNLVNKVGELAQAFIDGDKRDAEERAAWLVAMKRTADSLDALQTSVDTLPERIAEKLSTKQEKEKASE